MRVLAMLRSERMMVRASTGVFCVSLATWVFSCSRAESGDEQVGVSRQEALTAPVSATITLSAPHLLAPTLPVLDAADSVVIGPEATISGTTVAMGSGPGGVNAGPEVVMNDTWSRGGVNLGPLLQLAGTLHASIVTADPTAVVGAFDKNPLFDPPSTLSWNVTFPSGAPGASVHSLNGQTSSVAPGSYSSIAVDAGGAVTLQAGSYFLTNLTVSAGASVSLDQANGPVVVYVSGAITINATLKSLTGDPPNLLIGYLGTNTVTVGASGAPFNGALVAPFTQLSLLQASAAHAGFFAARDISIAALAKVQYVLPAAVVAAASPPPAPVTSLPRPLPSPPSEAGCYIGTLNGWVQVQCADPQGIQAEFGKVDVDMGIASTKSGATPAVPIVFGQVETTFTNVPSEQDTYDPVRESNQACDAGGPSSGFQLSDNQWSIQNNTNFFPCGASGADPTGAFECVVQFAIQSVGTTSTVDTVNGEQVRTAGTSAICIVNANGGHGDCDPNQNDKAYDETCVGVLGENLQNVPNFVVNTRTGPLQKFDFANIAGSTFNDSSGTPMVGLVTQFSWGGAPTNDQPTLTREVNQIPGLYAIVAKDTFGLANHWTTVTGSVLGFSDTGMATFGPGTGVVNRVLASSCAGDTTASGPVCSGAPLQPNAVSTLNVTTGEQNSLTLVSGSSGIAFPNQDLAVTEFLSSTNGDGSCTGAGAASYVYMKDNIGDNGGIPSNSGALTFWESPDIFVLSQPSTRPGMNDMPTDWIVTPGQSYDIYLRVHNDGCAPGNGLTALIYVADPNMGLTSWELVTKPASTYVSDGNPADSQVAPYSAQILGPFPWSPSALTSPGHKCMLAAIQTVTEPGPAAASPLPPAYNSNQVAQRNVEFTGSDCLSKISNTTNADVFLRLGVNAIPSTPVPASIKLTFSDANPKSDLSSWASTWQAQAPGTLSAVTTVSATGTSVALTITGTSQIALNTVTLPAGDSPTVSVTFTPALGASALTVAVAATLTDVSGDVLSQNGGTCVTSAPQTVK